MNQPGRIAVTTVATVVAFYASEWFGVLAWFIVTKPFGFGDSASAIEPMIMTGSAVGGGALAGWYTWRWSAGNRSLASGVLATTLRWAVVTGGIGFALGFFGPIIFMPGANQGPLLGIFITGPLGVI